MTPEGLKASKKLGELGLMGVLVPHEYGGSGFGYHEYVTAIIELAKIDPGIGLSMAAILPTTIPTVATAPNPIHHPHCPAHGSDSGTHPTTRRGSTMPG